MWIPLFNEIDVFRFTLALKLDILIDMNSSIDELFFRKESLEDDLSVVEVKTMQIFGFDLLLR